MTVPFELTICRAAEVMQLTNSNRYDAIISIKDPCRCPILQERRIGKRRDRLSTRCKLLLCIDFSDNEFVPRTVVYDIAQFAKQLQPGMKVLVHCMLGISRSTAAAMIVLREHGMDYAGARAEVFRVRPLASPNFTMLRLYREMIDVLHPDDAESQ